MLSFDLNAGMNSTYILSFMVNINPHPHTLTTINYADLRPAFHWNLKQLFVFVVAEYESAANVSRSPFTHTNITFLSITLFNEMKTNY